MSSKANNKSTKGTSKANKSKLDVVADMLEQNKQTQADKQKSIYTGMYGIQVIRN